MKTSCMMSISKVFIDQCSTEQKRKIKNTFDDCLQWFSSEKTLAEQKKLYLKINGK